MASVTPGGQIMAVNVPTLEEDRLAEHLPGTDNTVRQISGGEDGATCTASQASFAVFAAGDLPLRMAASQMI